MKAFLIVLALFASQPGPITESRSSFVVFPQDCNANPPMLFGGKVLAEMDRCAGVTVRRYLWASPFGAKDAVTVAIDKVQFHKAGKVKDLVTVSGKVVKAGNKSITVKVKVERESKDGWELLAEGEFTFVAYDLAEEKAIPHGLPIMEGK